MQMYAVSKKHKQLEDQSLTPNANSKQNVPIVLYVYCMQWEHVVCSKSRISEAYSVHVRISVGAL